jgi:hypothetical protein
VRRGLADRGDNGLQWREDEASLVTTTRAFDADDIHTRPPGTLRVHTPIPINHLADIIDRRPDCDLYEQAMIIRKGIPCQMNTILP